MKNDYQCPYNILPEDVTCEYKSARMDLPKTITLHYHDGYELLMFLNGDVSMFVGSIEKKLVRGDLVIVPPYAVHGLNLEGVPEDVISHYERVVLNIRPNFLKTLSDESADLFRFLKELSSEEYSIVHIDSESLNSFLRMLDRLGAALRNRQFGHSLMSKAALTEFIVNLAHYAHHSAPAEFKNSMPRAVTEVIRYVDENLTGELTVEMIAEKLHHNTDYIGRLFKKATGGALKYYINAKKMSLAQQYLSQGYPPSDVCYMVGFENYSSFSRRFRAQVGMPPKQYQQKEWNDKQE